MKNSGPVAALTALLLFAPIATYAAEESTSAEQDKKEKEEKPIPSPKLWTSKHQIRIGGKAVDYEATTRSEEHTSELQSPI